MPFWLAVSEGSELVRQSEQNQDAGLAGGMVRGSDPEDEIPESVFLCSRG